MNGKTTRTNSDTGGGLKQKLIAVGEEILETQGLEAFTLRAAARAAGVSHMAPYRHFEDKEALLAVVAERGFRALTGTMDDAMASQESAALRLRAMGVAYVVFACERPALYRLMFHAGIGDNSRFPELVEAGETTFSRCCDAVAADNPTIGSSNGAGTLHRALATWALVHGLASLMIDGKIALPRHDPAAMAETIEAILTSI